MIREPSVAGQFYPDSETSLRKQIDKFIHKDAQKLEAKGAVLPHAGYIYSGFVAGATLSEVGRKETLIILGPNHTGYGERFSIMTEGTWRTPLGDIDIDSELANSILSHCNHLKDDHLAHIYEHSIEVELPFLQFLYKDIKFVPIIVSVGNLKIYREIGEKIAETLKELEMEDKVMIIASSDMTHYESKENAQTKDKQAIEQILKLDEEMLLNKIETLNISMCGYIPAIIMLVAVKILGAKTAKLVKYQTSGDVTGDYSSVVGYAGIIIS